MDLEIMPVMLADIPSSEFKIYSTGICHMSVCSSLPQEEVEKLSNTANPTGIESKWRVSEGNFRTGEENGCKCPDHPESHRHWLLSC